MRSIRVSLVLLAGWFPLFLGADAIAQSRIFEAPTVVASNTQIMESVGDFDGDGDVDAIGVWVLQNVPTVALQRHDGKGNFSPGWTVAVPTNSGQRQLAVGSFGGNDQRDDFVVVQGLDVYVYQCTAGTPLLMTSFAVTNATTKLLVADVDRDGLDDLILVGNGVRHYRNQGQNRGFALASSHARGMDGQVIDVDRDGAPDLAVTDVGPTHLSVETLRNTNGSFVPSRVYPSVVPHVPPQKLIAGDVDGDGDADLVIFGMNGEYVVLRETASDAFAVEPPAQGGPATDFGDVDGDGDLDGLCCGGGGGGNPFNVGTSVFEISINDGNGRFAPALRVQGLGATRLAGAVDLDGDRSIDLVAGRCVFYDAGSFVRAPKPDQPPAWLTAKPRHIVDVDGDGDPDVEPALAGTFVNDGFGQLNQVSLVMPTPPLRSVFVGPGHRCDADGDGLVDLIVEHKLDGQFQSMRFLKNVGGGFVDAGPATAIGQRFANTNPGVAADIDKDGDIDWVVSDHLNTTTLWRNDGRGFFQPVSLNLLYDGVIARVADLDADGHMDLIILHQYMRIYYGRANGGFTLIPVPAEVWSRTDRLDLADADGDGDIDILTNSTGNLNLWRQDNRSFTPTSLGVIYRSFQKGRAQFCDVDADGRPDVIAGPQYDGSDAILVLRNTGSGFTTVQTIAGGAWSVADFDGDGDPDLMTSRLARNRTFHGATAGMRRQYGYGTPGAGLQKPVLGATGPFRVRESTTLRLRGARGGRTAHLVIGTQPSDVPNFILPGLRGYASPALGIIPIPLTGTAGAVGTGGFDLAVRIPTTLFGATLCFQCFVADDAAPHGVTHTNGLMIHYGR